MLNKREIKELACAIYVTMSGKTFITDKNELGATGLMDMCIDHAYRFHERWDVIDKQKQEEKAKEQA